MTIVRLLINLGHEHELHEQSHDSISVTTTQTVIE